MDSEHRTTRCIFAGDVDRALASQNGWVGKHHHGATLTSAVGHRTEGGITHRHNQQTGPQGCSRSAESRGRNLLGLYT